MELLRCLFVFVFAIVFVDVDAITASPKQSADTALSNDDTTLKPIDVKTCSFEYEDWWSSAVDECKKANKQLLCYRSKKEVDDILNTLQILTYDGETRELWFYNKNCSTTEMQESLTVTFEQTKDGINHDFRTSYGQKRFVCCSEVFGPCSNHMCENEGVCSIQDKAPVCTCNIPYSGEFCEIDPCTNHTCLNGGTCYIRNNEASCKCASPYWGDFCETDPCTDNPCKNGATCNLYNERASCDCARPYEGEFCELDPCTNYTCEHDGYCSYLYHLDYQPKCICDRPYFGERCETDPCTGNPCKNGGTCSVESYEAKCDCVKPYMGEFCETDSRYVGIMSLLGVLAGLVLILLVCGCCYMNKIVEVLRLVSRSTGGYGLQNRGT